MPVMHSSYRSVVLTKMLYFIITVIFTKELVMATDDQCGVYQFKPPFFPGQSCEDIYNMNPESRDMSGYYWILNGPSRVYCGMTYTGSSWGMAEDSRHQYH